MAKDDLMAHAASDVDFYALLDVQFESSAADIRRAYRKTALKYHPDKLGAAFDPEKFHLLQIANDVLSDEAAKAAYDRKRNARLQQKRKEEMFEGRRRKMKEELEARERGGISAVGTGQQGVKRERDEGQEMDQEIMRLAEEGKRRRMEVQKDLEKAESKTGKATPIVVPPMENAVPKTKRVDTPQTAEQEKEEEDEVARLERRIREIAEAKERKKAEKKARKSGVSTPRDTPSASPAPSSASGDWKTRIGAYGVKDSTPLKRRDLSEAKSGAPISSPKFSFSPKPRVAPAGKPDEFAATMERLKQAEKKRLEDEIRKREAETHM